MKKRNPVAKNVNKVNRPATHKDRKKESKRGRTKHKDSQFILREGPGVLVFLPNFWPR